MNKNKNITVKYFIVLLLSLHTTLNLFGSCYNQFCEVCAFYNEMNTIFFFKCWLRLGLYSIADNSSSDNSNNRINISDCYQ